MFLKVHYQMFSGFLISVSGQIIANEVLVLAKASHSQRMNDSRVGLLQKEEQGEKSNVRTCSISNLSQLLISLPETKHSSRTTDI